MQRCTRGTAHELLAVGCPAPARSKMKAPRSQDDAPALAEKAPADMHGGFSGGRDKQCLWSDGEITLGPPSMPQSPRIMASLRTLTVQLCCPALRAASAGQTGCGLHAVAPHVFLLQVAEPARRSLSKCGLHVSDRLRCPGASCASPGRCGAPAARGCAAAPPAWRAGARRSTTRPCRHSRRPCRSLGWRPRAAAAWTARCRCPAWGGRRAAPSACRPPMSARSATAGRRCAAAGR